MTAQIVLGGRGSCRAETGMICRVGQLLRRGLGEGGSPVTAWNPACATRRQEETVLGGGISCQSSPARRSLYQRRSGLKSMMPANAKLSTKHLQFGPGSLTILQSIQT